MLHFCQFVSPRKWIIFGMFSALTNIVLLAKTSVLCKFWSVCFVERKPDRSWHYAQHDFKFGLLAFVKMSIKTKQNKTKKILLLNVSLLLSQSMAKRGLKYRVWKEKEWNEREHWRLTEWTQKNDIGGKSQGNTQGIKHYWYNQLKM